MCIKEQSISLDDIIKPAKTHSCETLYFAIACQKAPTPLGLWLRVIVIIIARFNFHKIIVQESTFIANKRNLVECFNFLINFNQRMI